MSDIPLSWLFNQRRLNLRPIVTPREQFSTVQVSELRDPTDFTAPGAIILTLGLAFQADPNEFARYAQVLAAAGVQAIGFGTGLTFSEVPQPLIDAASRHHLTLFEVPRATPFISIIDAVTTEQTRLDNNAQFALHRQQERLNQAASGGIDELIERAAQELHAAVAIAADTGAAVARRDFKGLSALSYATTAAAQAAGTSGARSTTTKDGATIATITSVFSAKGRRRFALAVSHEGRFDSYARALIRHLTGLAGLLLQHPDAGTRHTLGSLALSAQLSGARTTLLDSSLASAFSPISVGGRVTFAGVHADSPARLNRALATLGHTAADAGFPYFQLLLPEPTSALLAFAPTVPFSPRFFGRYAATLQVSLLAEERWEDFTQDRLTALLTHARSLPVGMQEHFSTAAPAWLGDNAVHNALSRRRAATVDVLRDYDSVHNTELLRTLTAYLLADAQLAAAATQIGVHRHTVRTRIDKAQALCGVDLANPVARAELLLLCVS